MSYNFTKFNINFANHYQLCNYLFIPLLHLNPINYLLLYPLRENFQRLQQDLAQMIQECLDKRSLGSAVMMKRKTLAMRHKKMEKESEQVEDEDQPEPEYLHLATVNHCTTLL